MDSNLVNNLFARAQEIQLQLDGTASDERTEGEERYREVQQLFVDLVDCVDRLEARLRKAPGAGYPVDLIDASIMKLRREIDVALKRAE